MWRDMGIDAYIILVCLYLIMVSGALTHYVMSGGKIITE
jgi:hypothetical protein